MVLVELFYNKNRTVNDVKLRRRKKGNDSYRQTALCIYHRFNFCHHDVVKKKQKLLEIVLDFDRVKANEC